ncbi:MAG: hypothetical protein F4124_05075 [Acidimicrobiia bacterium]|nr:hypothetical protein [Acidimicrobiia bacterium]MYB73919.1 hypothetical protein [Acidimicrobiia bacterium]MYH96476.1 hypothetical protein [Acidimicrobiia bacterium]MYH98785.1 hypothetical protein [Acidimicrobiia bacterium]MYL10540.1 hypothetical protein [Acidimicrobiia bacterium]
MCPPTGCPTSTQTRNPSPSQPDPLVIEGGWTTRYLSGTVGELHQLSPDPEADREVWLMSPYDSALVLGSAQPDAAAASSEAGVVRRRSGGGAVLVVPDDTVWIDVVISRNDPLWDDDVNRAPLWLGQVWRAALALVGVDGGVVLDRYEPGPWGRLACFASKGPGEVLIGAAKAVGVTQRRTRNTARFQTLVYRRWDPEELAARLAIPADQVDDFREALSAAAYAVDAYRDDINAAFLSSLPR